MNFLWFFRNAARGRRRRRSEARRRKPTEGDRRASWWCDDERFSVLMCPSQRKKEVGPRNEGLALERFGDRRVGGPSFAPKTVFVKSKNVLLCRHLMSLLESDERPVALLWTHPSMQQLFHHGVHLWCPRPSRPVNVCWRRRLFTSRFSSGEAVMRTEKVKSEKQERLLMNLWPFKHSQSGSFVLSGKLLFLDALGFNWCWDPSIVTGAGWGCSHQKLQSRLPW